MRGRVEKEKGGEERLRRQVRKRKAEKGLETWEIGWGPGDQLERLGDQLERLGGQVEKGLRTIGRPGGQVSLTGNQSHQSHQSHPNTAHLKKYTPFEKVSSNLRKYPPSI